MKVMAVVVVAGYLFLPQPTPVVFDGQGTQCTEDMDCWDCTTMGNKICGPVKGD